MNPARNEGAAAVCASAVLAGIMASSKGSAIVAPRPRRNVRRGRCFFVMNMTVLSLLSRCHPLFSLGKLRDALHLEIWTLHNTKHDRRKLVIVFHCIANDLTNGRHIEILDTAAESIRHQLLRHRLHELVRLLR